MTEMLVTKRVKDVMHMLTLAADAGRSCPTNSEIATSIDASRGTACEIIATLENMNAITVERGRTWRVVTIVATGNATSRPVRGKMPPGSTGKSSAHASVLRQGKIADLCDLVAEEVPIKEAARLLGISLASATGMMAQVRRELGPQAR